MKSEKSGKFSRLLLSLFFFTAYITFFVFAAANALDANLYNYLPS